MTAHRSRSRVRAAGMLALAAAAAAVTVGAPAQAQTDPSPEDPSGSLSLDVGDLDALVTEHDPLRVRARVVNRSRADRDDLRLLATVHREPIGRFNYQQAMDAGVVGDIIHAFTAEVAEVPPQGARTVEVTQTAEQLGLTRPAGQEGVYPIRIQLQSGGQVVDELMTNLVYAPDTVGLPIAVAMLLPVAHPPSRDGQGVFVNDDLSRATEPDGGLGGLAAVLEERPDLPITLAVDGLSLEEASDVASGFLRAQGAETVARAPDSPEARTAEAFLGTVQEVASRPLVHVLALPYASADLVALERHGLDTEVSRHITDGNRAVEARTGDRPIEPMLWPPDGIDALALNRLRGHGIRTLVLSERYLELPVPRGPRSPSPVRRLRAGQVITTDTLVPDPWLEPTLTEDGLPPPLLAQRILGEIATVYFEVPGIGERGLLLAPRLGETVEPAVVAALLDDLAAASFSDLVTLATLSRRVAPGEEPIGLDYPAASRSAELPGAYLNDLWTSRQALRSLDGMLVDDQVTPVRFDQVLMQASSVHYRHNLAAGQELLDTVTARMEELYEAVEIPPVPPVTLTSVEGQLPVTIRSEADVPLRVMLHLRTASFEIEGGTEHELVLEPGRAEILTFDVRALRPGRTDGVQLLVTDVDSAVELAEGTVVVRSTTFSVAGLVVTVGAALFLLAWGVREAARRRRGRRPSADQAARPQRRMPTRT